MPVPWLAALRLIPWATLVANGPAIARAADTLLSGARASTQAQTARAAAAEDEIRRLTTRVEELEQQNRAQAELAKQMSDQIQALTLTNEVLAGRQRWLVVLGGLAIVVLLAVVLTRG
jgi:TolA-binding protein